MEMTLAVNDFPQTRLGKEKTETGREKKERRELTKLVRNHHRS